jgi:hypothetical protein
MIPKRRLLIYAVLALALAFSAQGVWKTLANSLVWHLTYFGVHLARAIHQPDYDSVASARTFDALAIFFNALSYFAALAGLDRVIFQARSRKSERP